MTTQVKPKPKVIDLFCGIGGLSYGLLKEGFDVIAGIDNDDSCRFGYEYNTKAKFIHRDISEIQGNDINRLFGKREKSIRVLVGCAPCQPFSNLNSKKFLSDSEPLERFAFLVQETLPEIISMENVSGLRNMEKYPVFERFIDTLEKNNYEYQFQIVNVADYGVPQNRKRLVLLASKFGEIKLIEKTHKNNRKTVRGAIGNLEPIEAGETSKRDFLHRARKLSSMNYQRIRSTPHNGGDSSSWNKDLVLDCHKKQSGYTYRRSVYGRMRWDEPAPTMTTQCIGLGNGRFGHPEQNRAISLREAAIFQSFPKSYKFLDPNKPAVIGNIAKFVGNAVPIRLASAIGRSIKVHLKYHGK